SPCTSLKYYASVIRVCGVGAAAADREEEKEEQQRCLLWFLGAPREGCSIPSPLTSRTGTPLRGWFWDTGRRAGGGGGGESTSTIGTALARTNVDWQGTANAHIITANLPRVKREQVKVDVEVEDGSVLRINGEMTEEEGGHVAPVERRRGSFSLRFRLPENANMEGITCTLENWVLAVTVRSPQRPHHRVA
ncbi:hypothetical protein MUK42_22452, partial [Musa troglodytarum]